MMLSAVSIVIIIALAMITQLKGAAVHSFFNGSYLAHHGEPLIRYKSVPEYDSLIFSTEPEYSHIDGLSFIPAP